MKRAITWAAFSVIIGGAGAAHATTQDTVGKVVATQGHAAPFCRVLTIKEQSTGALRHFRIPFLPDDNSILSVAIAAQLSGLSVSVTWDPNVTTGCGTEPAVNILSMLSPN